MGGDLEKIQEVGKYFIEVWKACGMDLKNVEFIWTSEYIREHPELRSKIMEMAQKNYTSPFLAYRTIKK